MNPAGPQYGGVLAWRHSQRSRSKLALRFGLGRELPRPFRCWATTNTEDCFKAFDKRENAPWRSADVGGWAGALAQTDVLYVTRVQKERFATPAAYDAVRGSFGNLRWYSRMVLSWS